MIFFQLFWLKISVPKAVFPVFCCQFFIEKGHGFDEKQTD